MLTRHIDIDRHDAVTAAHNAVRVVVVAASVRARPHGDHPARLGHLVVDFAKGGRHFVRQRARNDDHIGLPRRRTEHNAEAVHVVAGRREMHHLHSTASQPECERPQGALREEEYTSV